MLALAEPGAFRFGGGGFLGLLLPMRLFPQDKQPGPTRTTFSLIDKQIFLMIQKMGPRGKSPHDSQNDTHNDCTILLMISQNDCTNLLMISQI